MIGGGGSVIGLLWMKFKSPTTHHRPPKDNLTTYNFHLHNGSVVATLSYGLGKRDDPIDLLLLRQVCGIQQDGIRRLPALLRVLGVPVNQPVCLLGDLLVGWSSLQLLDEATSRSLPRVGDKKDLHVGIRKDRRSDVPSVHYNRMCAGSVTHLLIHPGADLLHGGNNRHELGDVGSAELGLHQYAVKMGEERTLAGDEAYVVRSGLEDVVLRPLLRIAGPCPAEARNGDRAVQRARVDVTQP